MEKKIKKGLSMWLVVLLLTSAIIMLVATVSSTPTEIQGKELKGYCGVYELRRFAPAVFSGVDNIYTGSIDTNIIPITVKVTLNGDGTLTGVARCLWLQAPISGTYLIKGNMIEGDFKVLGYHGWFFVVG